MRSIKIGYHCSHEQFRPSELVRFAQRAEQAGFTQVLLHNVNRSQEQFIDAFGERVLPQVTKPAR